jgi:Lysyl oxidase
MRVKTVSDPSVATRGLGSGSRPHHVRGLGHSRSAIGALVLAASLAVAAFGVTLAGQPSAHAGSAGANLLPDVIVRPLTEIRIEKSAGVKLLRFASIIGNRGPGVVELNPDSPSRSAVNDCDGDGDPLNDRQAFQRLYRDADADGVFTRGVDTVFNRRYAGCSVFHAEHGHWHFEEFARYRLLRPKTGRAVATSEKVSFCVRDSIRFAATLPGSPAAPHFGDCTQDSVTGLSIGWADYYASNLPGQELDIRGLPDGRYCLRTWADPGQRLRESRDGNNGRSALLRIEGSTVTVLQPAC